MIRTYKGYILALLSMILVVSCYVWYRDLVSRYMVYQGSQESVNQLMAENQVLLRERDFLRDRVDRLGSDPIEIEAAIRRTRNLVRENERIYRIELPEDDVPVVRPRGGTTYPPESREGFRDQLITWYQETQVFLQERLQSWRHGVNYDSDTRDSTS